MPSIKSTQTNRLLDPLIALLREQKTGKVLLAISGGPDSRALLQCLLCARDSLKFELALAHVNHGWREESGAEAQALEKLARSLGLAFHLKVLDPKELTGNLEQACRLERLRFFAELSKKQGYESVLLGHHRDDQAETVLKRILEGASLQTCGGMAECSEFEGLRLLRPWLKVPKSVLLQYLQEDKTSYFVDATNGDTRFLRGRMRQEIFPLLEKSYGKNISASLARLGQESREFDAFMHEQYASMLESSVKGPYGCYLDCSRVGSPFLLRWILKTWFLRNNLNLSQAVIESAADKLLQGKADITIRTKSCRIYVDRGRIFLIFKDLELPLETPVVEGSFRYGPWQATVVEGEQPEMRGWEAAWKGSVCIRLPDGDCTLANYSAFSDTRRLQKLWTDCKIPACFRHLVPVIGCRGEVAQEFLSPKSKNQRFGRDRPYGAKHLYLEFPL